MEHHMNIVTPYLENAWTLIRYVIQINIQVKLEQHFDVTELADISEDSWLW